MSILAHSVNVVHALSFCACRYQVLPLRTTSLQVIDLFDLFDCWSPRLLSWILSNPEEKVPALQEYRQMLQRYIYELVHSEGNEDKYMYLDEVCQDTPPKRVMAKECGRSGRSAQECCYFVVPESEGMFAESDSSSDDADESRTLRSREIDETKETSRDSSI